MNKSNRRSFIYVFASFVAVTILSIAVCLFSVLHKPYQNVQFFKDFDELDTLSAGWELITENGSYNLTLPSRNEIEADSKSVTLVNRLPRQLPVTPAIMYRTSLQGIKIYIDGGLLYEYGDDQYRAFGKNNASIWNIVPLSEKMAGKEIRLQIISPYADYENTFNTFYIGTYASLLSFLVHTYMWNLVIILITLIIGVALLIYYFGLKTSKVPVSNQMFYVSVLAIFTSMWEFTECKLTQALVGNMAGFSTFNFIFLALMLIPMIMYVDTVEGHFYHRVLGPVEILLELNVVVQIILQLTGVADFYEMLKATHILIAVSALIGIATIERKFRKYREPGLLILLITLSIMGLGGIVEILITYKSGHVGGSILSISLLLLILSTGLQSVRNAQLTIEASRRAMAENAAKTTFLANMSHEIRTPMNAILAMSELLVNSEKMTPGNKDFASTIHSSAENLLDIINDILDFSKISSNKYEIVNEEYEVTDLIESVKDVIAIRACTKNLNFTIEINPDLPIKLIGDEGRIRQILLNLLNNSVKFTNEGDVKLKVDCVEQSADDITLMFTVTDTGIGIKPEDMENLFEAFIQVDKAKNSSIEGTGLGLAISKALAELMGGEIHGESEYGSGTVFTVTVVQKAATQKTFRRELCAFFDNPNTPDLVLINDSKEARQYENLIKECGIVYRLSTEDVDKELFSKNNLMALFEVSKNPYFSSQEFKGEYPGIRTVGVAGPLEEVDTLSSSEIVRTPFTITDLYKLSKNDAKEALPVLFTAEDAKVMVVDDNVVNLRIMREMLGRFGIRPTLCSDGEQAVAAMKIKNFNLIFMDQMMPAMDGIETAAVIRNLPEVGKEVKIVALTANAVKGVERLFKENGFDAFVSKPVSLDDIGKALLKTLPKEMIKEKR